MLKRLLRTKTFWAAMTGIAAAAERVATGAITTWEALQIVIPALLAVFVRDGIAKTQTPVADAGGNADSTSN